MNLSSEEIITALRICARNVCPENCPRYADGDDGEECARSLMELAADALGESRRREQEILEDLYLIAGDGNSALRCNCCKYNPDDMGCELDGSQFDDDGECHFEWCGAQNNPS
jgi:hypothetical protein